MSKPVLLLGASLFALCANGAFATGSTPIALSAKSLSWLGKGGAKTLYNQNSDNAHTAITSENETGGFSSSYDDQGADDFVVPKGQTWTVTEDDVTGQYFESTGPANSENVFFYKDRKGMPGKPVRNGAFENLNGGGGPDFAVKLPGKGLKLKAGRYWVSVVANMYVPDEGLWAWEVSSRQHGKPAMWQNP
jgi:hypothetical protein